MDNWIKVKRTTEDMDALVQDFTDVLKDFGITVDTDETLASAEDVDLYITIADELDDKRQKLSLMDCSLLPNAELEKLFDAIDALVEQISDVRAWMDHENVRGEDADKVTRLDEATGDVQDMLDKLTLLIPWADDWNNTKKMAEGTGE